MCIVAPHCGQGVELAVTVGGWITRSMCPSYLQARTPSDFTNMRLPEYDAIQTRPVDNGDFCGERGEILSCKRRLEELPALQELGELGIEAFVGRHLVQIAVADEPHLARVAHIVVVAEEALGWRAVDRNFFRVFHYARRII